MSVSVTVEMRDASEIEIGTVYGPPPTRNAGGGEIRICAEPMPVVVVCGGVVVTGGAVGAGGVVGAGCVAG